MSEIPERIEREMYEIRNRMNPDVQDLKKHTEPKVIGKQVGDTVKGKARDAAKRFINSLKNSASRQFGLVREAGRSRNPEPLKEAVKSDPRPMVILALVVMIMLMTVRKITR